MARARPQDSSPSPASSKYRRRARALRRRVRQSTTSVTRLNDETPEDPLSGCMQETRPAERVGHCPGQVNRGLCGGSRLIRNGRQDADHDGSVGGEGLIACCCCRRHHGRHDARERSCGLSGRRGEALCSKAFSLAHSMARLVAPEDTEPCRMSRIHSSHPFSGAGESGSSGTQRNRCTHPWAFLQS